MNKPEIMMGFNDKKNNELQNRINMLKQSMSGTPNSSYQYQNQQKAQQNPIRNQNTSQNMNTNRGMMQNTTDNSNTRRGHVSVFAIFTVFLMSSLILFTASYFITYFYTIKKDATFTLPSYFGMDLEGAIFKMQAMGLYPYIEIAYDSRMNYKDKIIAQMPEEGTPVAPGRKVKLILSKGPAVDKIENYVGKDVDEVKNLIKSLFSNSETKALKFGEVEYRFDETRAGTILEQYPPGGSPIGDDITLNFIASKGPKLKKIATPDLKDMYFTDAIKTLSEAGIKFVFSVSPEPGPDEGVVMSQSPKAGTPIEESDVASVSIAKTMILSDSDKFDILAYDLPEYSTKVNVEVNFIMPSGQKTTYFRLKTFGGRISFPYLIEKNTIITITVDGADIYKYTVN